MPTSEWSQLQVGDVLMEVSIMERYGGEPSVCGLLDFGVGPAGFALVMPLYRCSLDDWRARLPCGDAAAVAPLHRLFCNIFRLVRACRAQAAPLARTSFLYARSRPVLRSGQRAASTPPTGPSRQVTA